ncbi:glycosyltransferase [Herbiconiux sp. L3-i23]|uniref:glycosyltransferase n=1 Tax=Herbiconiux sp. L3-i23 TaxID=2905871 RepID=UPI002074820A|nr:glycosyltransferase [Herbiconiux sp. L3-i23]
MTAASDRPAIAFPEGRQFAVTWGLTTQYGGMTAAMLRRSRAFAQLAGRPVEVLTFDARDDYDEIIATLTADGRLGDGVEVRNLWDDLERRTGSLPELRGGKRKALDAFDPLAGGEGRTRRRFSDTGELLQTDRFRPNGTVAVSDRRDVAQRGTVGGRSIVLCDAAGEPVVGFTRARPFYHAWLDLLTGDDDAFFIVDSKTSAPTLAGYGNPRATRVHLVHNSHLATDARPWGAVKPSRREAVASAADFESVVLLSDRQRDDVDSLIRLGERLDVVPNATALPSRTPALDRDPRAGVSIAGLEARKRVDHALLAVGRARSAGADVRLDVYGDGPERSALDALVAEHALGDAVVLHGFERGAVEHFADASFFTLTSTSEGFPLVLAEGMSRGSIPISYDMPYGPADIIDDGVNGVLIPLGDFESLADALARIASTPAAELEPMRVAAMETAARFTDQAVTRRWADVLTRAAARRPRGRAVTIAPRGGTASRGRDGLTVSADFRLSGVDTEPGALDAAIAVHGTPLSVELRRPATVRRTLRHGVWRAKAVFEPAAVDWIPSGTDFTVDLELRVGGRLVRERIAVGSEGTGSFGR